MAPRPAPSSTATSSLADDTDPVFISEYEFTGNQTSLPSLRSTPGVHPWLNAPMVPGSEYPPSGSGLNHQMVHAPDSSGSGPSSTWSRQSVTAGSHGSSEYPHEVEQEQMLPPADAAPAPAQQAMSVVLSEWLGRAIIDAYFGYKDTGEHPPKLNKHMTARSAYFKEIARLLQEKDPNNYANQKVKSIINVENERTLMAKCILGWLYPLDREVAWNQTATEQAVDEVLKNFWKWEQVSGTGQQ